MRGVLEQPIKRACATCAAQGKLVHCGGCAIDLGFNTSFLRCAIAVVVITGAGRRDVLLQVVRRIPSSCFTRSRLVSMWLRHVITDHDAFVVADARLSRLSFSAGLFSPNCRNSIWSPAASVAGAPALLLHISDSPQLLAFLIPFHGLVSSQRQRRPQTA